MRGSSRASAAAAQAALDAALTPKADSTSLGEELFAVTAVIDSSASLRRALADPSREGQAKRALGGKGSATAASLVEESVAGRWAAERDLTDTLESLAVQSVLASAERSGHIDRVEDELFRFERIVASDAGLRDALSARSTDGAGKATLVRTLLEGKAAPETVLRCENCRRILVRTADSGL